MAKRAGTSLMVTNSSPRIGINSASARTTTPTNAEILKLRRNKGSGDAKSEVISAPGLAQITPVALAATDRLEMQSGPVRLTLLLKTEE